MGFLFAQSDDDLFGSDDDLFGDDDFLIEEVADVSAKSDLSKGVLFATNRGKMGLCLECLLLKNYWSRDKTIKCSIVMSLQTVCNIA